MAKGILITIHMNWEYIFWPTVTNFATRGGNALQSTVVFSLVNFAIFFNYLELPLGRVPSYCIYYRVHSLDFL